MLSIWSGPNFVVWEWVKRVDCVVKRLENRTFKCFSFPKASRLLTALKKEAFENILGKGENAGNQHFLLFPKRFLPV